MPHDVRVRRRVTKRLRTVPPNHCRQTLDRLRSLAETPRPQDGLKLRAPLEGYRESRSASTELYTVDDEARTVLVYLVIPCGEGYPHEGP